MRRRATAATMVLVAALLFVPAAAGPARAEVVRQDGVRIGFDARIAPKRLPRHGSVPVAVTLALRIGAEAGAPPPQLARVRVAISRSGRFDPTGIAVCPYRRIVSTTTRQALRVCAGSLVGEGRFRARILIPEQAPFPSAGPTYVFYGHYRGKPALLAHIYGTDPAPSSLVVPFLLSRGRGEFGTVLTAELPKYLTGAGYVKTLRLTIGDYGAGPDFVRAGCPAPGAFGSALFALARATVGLADGRTLDGVLRRGCTVR